MNTASHASAASTTGPVQLRRVCALQARLSRQLGSGRVWRLNGPGLPWTQAELLLAPASAPMEGSAGARLQLQGRHGTFVLADASLLSLLTGVQYPDDADAEVLHELHRFALARIPAPLMECLGGPFHVLGADQGECAEGIGSPADIACLLTLTDINGECHAFVLHADATTLCRWSSTAGWQRHAVDLRASAALPAPLRNLTFTGGLHLGRRAVSADRLRRLNVGDALLIPGGDDGLKPPIRMLLGSALATLCHQDDESYVFEGWVTHTPPLSNPSHVKAIEKVPSIMDALKVDLDFIVGRLSMTVGQLTALQPGQILPLELATPPHVRIVAHGTELGSGELIDLDGRLAVEITEWGTRP